MMMVVVPFSTPRVIPKLRSGPYFWNSGALLRLWRVVIVEPLGLLNRVRRWQVGNTRRWSLYRPTALE